MNALPPPVLSQGLGQCPVIRGRGGGGSGDHCHLTIVWPTRLSGSERTRQGGSGGGGGGAAGDNGIRHSNLHLACLSTATCINYTLLMNGNPFIQKSFGRPGTTRQNLLILQFVSIVVLFVYQCFPSIFHIEVKGIFGDFPVLRSARFILRQACDWQQIRDTIRQPPVQPPHLSVIYIRHSGL